jgi:hypothetical protein
MHVHCGYLPSVVTSDACVQRAAPPNALGGQCTSQLRTAQQTPLQACAMERLRADMSERWIRPSDQCEGDPSDGLFWMRHRCRGFAAKRVGRGQLGDHDVLVCAQPLVLGGSGPQSMVVTSGQKTSQAWFEPGRALRSRLA